jgi:pimeloyl-ACP methyl ester carboxylesterase
VTIDDLGGRVNLIGLCQGGWVAAMIAARFPQKVNSLVLAGSPIDADAGDGPIKRMVHASPMSFYEELVALGGGLMRGKLMLQGWKNMHPEQDYFQDHIDLYEHIDDPAYLKKEEAFSSWYENPDRFARPLVSPSHSTIVQREPLGQGNVRWSRPSAELEEH